MSVLAVYFYTFFSANSKQIWIPFGTKLLVAPEKVLKQQYLVKQIKPGEKCNFLFSYVNKIPIVLWL